MLDEPLPFSTTDIAPVPGTIKSDYEDFEVSEIPLYLPSGAGDHVYVTIEKRGLTTQRALRDMATALGGNPRDVGYAGLKDARGVTRQTFSFEHLDPHKAESLDIPRIRVLSVSRHTNKLRIGHLKGNRFSIKVRDTDAARLSDVQAVMTRLFETGAPNYFGPQRFGNRGDTWEIGGALLRGDFDAAAEIIAGRASDLDEGRVLEARRLFDEKKWDEAAAAWPGGFRECRVVCLGMQRFGGNAKKAVLALDKKALAFYLSALQSKLFNDVTATRLGEIHTVETGDAAWKHENGAVFLVEDGALEAPRARAFEISPTGPLFGKKMKQPAGRVLEIEREALSKAGFTEAEFGAPGPFQCQGARRPLRCRPEDPAASSGTDERGGFIQLAFSLPPGTFATAIVREICKDKMISADGLAE